MTAPRRDDAENGPEAWREELWCEELWRELDDTLADGPSPAAVPEEAKQWLGEQRFVHGLLRAMHTADAAAREGRIEAMLARIDHEAKVQPRRRWFLVAAAASLLASLGVWAALPERLPTAEASVERAASQLSRDVDRRFRMEMVFRDAQGSVVIRNEFSLVTRPGKRFRVEGKVALGAMQLGPLGEYRVGSDGEELWILSASGFFRRAVPLAESELMLRGVGGGLELGYVDVHGLVRRLPDEADLRLVGRETDASGRSLLHIEAMRRPMARGVDQRTTSLWCDEVTGMVECLEVEVDMEGGAMRWLRFEYLGEEPAGLVDYKRPW
ncbi:MAG: hypothetical protein ABIP94_14615 [Planctomycetota bacterium]